MKLVDWWTSLVGRQDPLVITLGAIVLAVLVERFLFRKRPIGRALIRVVLLILLTMALLRDEVLPYEPLRSTGIELHDVSAGVLKIVWWLGVAWLSVGLLRVFITFERRPREGKLVQDLLATLIYLAAAFAIVAYVLDLPVQGLLATSGAIAIILGLALQSTLNDLFSGLVLSFSRPYRADDWIRLQGGAEGKVVELNWRATHILTSQSDLAIVPNSTIAKTTIVNVSSPSIAHGLTAVIRIQARTPPQIGADLLELALRNARLVMTEPKPSVMINVVNGAYTEFAVTYFASDLGVAGAAQNELLDLIYRHLWAAGIAMALPKDYNSPPDPARSLLGERSGRECVMDIVTVFTSLTTDEKTKIAKGMKERFFEQHATLLERGTMPDALSIVGAGVLSVTRAEAGVESEVLRLGPGDHFGEIGLLTGSPSFAAITALSSGIVYEMKQADLASILEARPQVAKELSQALARHMAAGRCVGASDLAGHVQRQGMSIWFFERIHRLFELKAS